jgi:ribonuclease P protein component
MEGKQHTLGKEEHLCSKKLTEELFKTGQRLMVFPYSVHWKICPKALLPKDVRVQVLISTSKRYFHHAVDRNRVKRLMREAYRLNRHDLIPPDGQSLRLCWMFVGTELPDFPHIETAAMYILRDLQQRLHS